MPALSGESDRAGASQERLARTMNAADADGLLSEQTIAPPALSSFSVDA